MTGARVEWLTVVGDPDRWRSMGLAVTADGLIPLFGASLRIALPDSGEAGASATGIASWTLSGVDDRLDSVDGLPTRTVASPHPVFAEHDLDVVAVDHVVVLTPDLLRTSAAITQATGCELKRVREVGTMRQGFHRIGRGGLIVELVERPDVAPGPAAFWGAVLTVTDLDAARARLGDERVGEAKDAVQPGRRIATVRAAAGLGLPIALMSDES